MIEKTQRRTLYMDKKAKQELLELFDNFARETQASSFAVNNLLNRTLGIIEKYDTPTEE